jgi:hypothetical protein
LLRVWNEVDTGEKLSLAREPCKNGLIELFYLLVHAEKNDTLREELIRVVRNMDARIDDVNEGINGVLYTMKVIWESDVEGIISVLAMAHFQLPLCKVGLFFNVGVKVHILMKVKNCNMPPEDRPLHTGSYNLSLGTLEDDQQDLLKVPTKDNSKTTKGLVRVAQIFKEAINCLHDVTMLHGCLIPYDQVSLMNQISQLGVFRDGVE